MNQATLTQTTSTPTETDSPDKRDTSPKQTSNQLTLSYQNESGNAAVIRRYTNHNAFVREVSEDWMYNFIEEQWELTFRSTHDWDLAPDEETLAGDGSNWRGTGQNWEHYFTNRHRELLSIRFRYDDIDSVATETFRQHTKLETELKNATDLDLTQNQ